MISLSQWRSRKAFVEFNGPVGQPDPTGVSTPVAAPRPSPSTPAASTQPGMAVSQGKHPTFDQSYQQFLSGLKLKPAGQQSQVLQQLQRELGPAQAAPATPYGTQT